ncbi:MAG: hypothetical protein MUF71_11605 [Candidatus Kapabacteria bacterium]|jgi:outer membrane protein OmpA-like peptidoglycan-associated protein|nr:hypothetical protein [Candidatus Kapabacteria bacterium]
MSRFCYILIGIIAFLLAVEQGEAQQTSVAVPQVRDTIDYKLIRTDDEDFAVFVKPAEVVEWGIGLFAQGKVSANMGNLLTRSNAPSQPSFFFQAYEPTGTSVVGVDIRPTVEYGLSLYAPMLANVAGRNIGVNLDVYLASYRFGVQYLMSTMLSNDAFQVFLRQNSALENGEYNFNIFPKFYSTYRYLNFAPMLNISGFLLGANIGIPFALIPSEMRSPSNSVLGMSQRSDVIPQANLRIIIEPRIGIIAPIITTRSGALNFLATISWMPPTLAPLGVADSLLIRSSNTSMQNAMQTWWNRERANAPMGTTLAATPFQSPVNIHNDFLLSPLSISVGLSYVFHFGNASVLDEFERESYRADSVRGQYARINKVRDTIRTRSTDLADSLANGIIAQSKLKDSLAAIEKRTEIQSLQRRQDSVRKAQEREIFAAKEELAITMGIKSSLESQKKDLEKKNKQKEEALAAKSRELSEKQRALDEKQRLLEEAKQKVFEAKLGSIIGMNEDGSEMQENPTLRVEEFSAKSIRPLLPIVFFDQSSSVIPARYRQIKPALREGYTLPKEALQPLFQLHGEMLNIVAKRLQQKPLAKLTLSGIQAPTESDPKVAARRAEAVADYFISTWKIPSERLIRQTRPAAQGMNEGRSVALSSDDETLLAPYILPTVARSATPPVITVGININAGAGLKQWQLAIRQIVENEDIELKDTTSKAQIPRYSWFVNDEQATMPRSQNPLTISLEATDITNAKAPEAPFKELKVENLSLAQKQASGKADSEVLLYELLFSTALNELSPESKALLPEIKRRIQADSKVRVTVFNPRNAQGTASDIAQMLGIEQSKAIIRISGAKRFSAQTSEANIFNQSMLVRIDNPAKE